ncbi:MAG: NAD(P)/FAD-dependent oxidoreductase [Alphaproteobacteria bacterium]
MIMLNHYFKHREFYVKEYDAIIIGAGAAGLFCAYQAAKRGLNILLLDHNRKIGRKIKISGGGRCNFTNIHANAQNYLCASPHFVKPALKNYTASDFISLVEEHHIEYAEKELGQIFTQGGSQQIINMLLKLCSDTGVILQNPIHIDDVNYDDGQYILNYHDKDTKQKYSAQVPHLIIATGGLSFKKLGASGLGYDIAKKFGHGITPLMPSLVGLKFANDFAELSGISLLAKVQCNKISFTHQILFTHFGLSGPAILQISNYWQNGQNLLIDFLPNHNLEKLIGQARAENPKIKTHNLLSQYLPKKFVQYFLANIDFTDKNIADLTKKQISLLQTLIHSHQLVPTATAGYDRAEVTKGGVEIAQINPKSMESKIQNGLFFIGEVVDVTGWLGGYNFQWAWSSATLAAQNILT